MADGYRFTGIECDAKTISVVGLRSQLASITSITIPSEALSVEGLMAGKVVTVDVSQFLPEGVRMVTDNGDTTIHIRLDVERLSSRIYSIDKNDIVLTGKREGYDYTFIPDIMEVTVQGLEEDLDSLDSAAIKASTDVSQLEAGVHEAAISFEALEHGYEIFDYTRMSLTVTDSNRSFESEEDLEAGATASDMGESGETEGQAAEESSGSGNNH